MARPTYTPKEFALTGLTGISDRTLELHWGLYKGYVTNTNALTEQLAELSVAKITPASKLAYAELTRRLGFEYGGMVLHEYYFGNLAANGKGAPSPELEEALTHSFGSVTNWREDFVTIGTLRGVGWAILYQDPQTRQLSNHWVELHHHGVPSGFQPLLVMDVWEHAFLLDYKPAERGKYIEAFFANVDWTAVNARLRSS
ncbi:MAG: superoxide dismutase [Deltaproteobacteria bacterium]|nr:superoxide dismutase [Deltaproteobacteria bacterium]